MAITEEQPGPVTAPLSPSSRVQGTTLPPPQGSWLLAVRVRLRRRALDRELAEGSDPKSCVCRRTRAAELTRESTRLALATAYERLLACVVDQQTYRLLPVQWDGVRAARFRIEALSTRLRGDPHVRAQGVARARLLLMDRDSPLYKKGDVFVLDHQLRSILALL